MKWIWLPLIIGLCLGGETVLAQTCNAKIKTSTPVARFNLDPNGIVMDTLTGLQWKRCSLGQTWKKDSCQGEAHTLPFAIVSLVIETGWRLPTISELNSLVELRCLRPAINTQLFPNTVPAAYWSATRFVNKDGVYWQVNFLLGESVSAAADTGAYVRLVRNAPHKKQVGGKRSKP